MASYKNTQNSSKGGNKKPPLKLPSGPIDQWKEEALIECSEELAKRSKDVKTNQLRNFFSAVLRIKTDFAASGKYEDVHLALLMLKPKLAYAAGRNEDVGNFADDMREVVEATLKAGNEEGLKRFFLFVESVVAYHKCYGSDN
ncbi:CRISPR-associated protein Csm2 [Thermonema lapsum]|uniref:CRISPR system Cms protein Csm2 n=1 Tax=Thermonema lapsum TaxID=28195 RepID=A0A846MQS3_9BACT|nr:type III-A CRISPR-associated protein Csm2 [Thermonema lapsum]NIK73934.1 CRISPR-associated protein Csm2 [Thermonema lapsum]